MIKEEIVSHAPPPPPAKYKYKLAHVNQNIITNVELFQ